LRGSVSPKNCIIHPKIKRLPLEEKEKGISHTIKIGRINKLAVTRFIDYGLVLRNHNGDEEVLLPNAYVSEEMRELGKGIEVFVYHDSEDRVVASTDRPLAIEGEFGYFEVVDVQSFGAFVDWGLPKDLFVPLSQQKSHFRVGSKYILRVAIDEQTGRLYGSHKIGKWLEEPKRLTPSQKMESLIIAKTPMGYKVILDNRFEGMLYNDEIFEPLEKGERTTVYIKKVRSDGRIDCSLYPMGAQARKQSGSRKILDILRQAGGTAAVTTKSLPEEIERVFGMSKKSFKAAVNKLIDEEKIEIKDNTLKLKDKR
jgi:predicted RNA-binding protein (virulence factor B family)